MKNIQEWLDNYYPINEKCILNTEDNFDLLRKDVASLDFNSIKLNLFEGSLNFVGFDLLDEVACNLNQLPFFLLNGLEKLPKGVTKIVLRILKNDDVDFENIKKDITEKIASTYCKHEVITHNNKKGVNKTFLKIYFDIGIWRNRYDKHLRNIEDGVNSDFLAKQKGIILRLFNGKVQENKTLREENKKIVKTQKENIFLNQQLDRLVEKNRELQMEKIEMKKEAKETLRANMKAMEDIKAFELISKDEIIKDQKKQISDLNNLKNQGVNSIPFIKLQEESKVWKGKATFYKANLDLTEAKFKKLAGSYNDLIKQHDSSLEKNKKQKEKIQNLERELKSRDIVISRSRQGSTSSLESNLSYSRSRQGSFSNASHARRPSDASETSFFGGLFGSRTTSPTPDAKFITIDTLKANSQGLDILPEETPGASQTHFDKQRNQSQKKPQPKEFWKGSEKLEIEITEKKEVKELMNRIIANSGDWVIGLGGNYQNIGGGENEVIFANLFSHEQNEQIKREINATWTLIESKQKVRSGWDT